MAQHRVIIEVDYNEALAKAALAAAPRTAASLPRDSVPSMPGVELDVRFAPVHLPVLRPRTAVDIPHVTGRNTDVLLAGPQGTFAIRARVDDQHLEDLARRANVRGVFADVQIHPFAICPKSPAFGTGSDVERLLGTAHMQRIGMDGHGVRLAVVDTGINRDYLAKHGKPIAIDVANSWVPDADMKPGEAPVSHGTMVAFDAAIAAPRATFLDLQLLRSTASGLTGLLSDALAAFRHLCNLVTAPSRPGENGSLVVTNSWGMFNPSWDFPPANPLNYSDNPQHPFNRIVLALEQLGADILFACGNCGCECPADPCEGVCKNAIYGANGHPAVLTIGGADVSGTRVGYSTQGPGRLSRDKPDLCGYTHFRGSGVYAADAGTSAATPVVAGVLAALRTIRPYDAANPTTSPDSIRALMRASAQPGSSSGFDFDYGYGLVRCPLVDRTDIERTGSAAVLSPAVPGATVADKTARTPMETRILQFRYPGGAPAPQTVQAIFDLRPDEIDLRSGVVALDPGRDLYIVVVAASASTRIMRVLARRGADPTEGLFANPRVAAFDLEGPPSDDE